MKKEKLILGLVLFTIGFIGVLSILTMDIPLSEEVLKTLNNKFSSSQIEFLILLNPTIMLMLAVLLGISLHEKVLLDVPVIKGLIINKHHFRLLPIIKYGIIGGLISGLLISILGEVFSNSLIEIGDSLKPTLTARFLYGGFTEEILMRFGLMTFVIWLLSNIFKSQKPIIYWFGIVFTAVVFALTHLPIAFQSIEKPDIVLLSYILISNSIGGLVFGWLYWKKGLESAFIAHIFAHIIMLLIALL